MRLMILSLLQAVLTCRNLAPSYLFSFPPPPPPLAKLVPLAYGIKKLQISCVVEDDKVLSYDHCHYGNCIIHAPLSKKIALHPWAVIRWYTNSYGYIIVQR